MQDSDLRKKWLQLHRRRSFREDLRPEIKYSWERSYAAGVSPFLRQNPYICTQEELTRAQEASHYLLQVSEPVMNDLYEFVAGTGFVVALGDSHARVLKVIGDEEALDWAKSARFVEGSIWEENLVGTNAGALCCDLGKPVSVFGYEHFCLFSHVSASSCAPIIDQDRIRGVLIMVAPHNKVSNHTLGMVVASAKHIMSTMALERVNQYHKAVMESMSEGVLALDSNGNVTFMNDSCARILQLPHHSFVGFNVTQILGVSADNNYFVSKVTQGRTITDENFKLVTLDNNGISCNVTCNPLNNPCKASGSGTVVIVRESQRINHLVRKWVGGGAKITFDNIIGSDPKFLQVVKTARAAASSSSNILLLGESGTGKDVIAQAMHNASSRRNHPYVAINCAALPRDLIASELFGYDEGAFTGARKGGNIGKFELADQGTIFLDEIGDMPLDLQASLLRVLEEKTVIRLGGTRLIPVNVRIIAATNKDLETELKRNRFRQDLYYRLGVIKITIPPLRERPDDILLLAKHFLERICTRFAKPTMTLAPEVIEAFLHYDWPGNIREIQNVIEGAVQLAPGNIITYDLISEYLNSDLADNTGYRGQPRIRVNSAVPDKEKQLIMEYLSKYKYNKSEVAKAMGISRKTLYRRLNDYGIQ
ncbi:sigma-54-dependent Fis family transcriptional regulator [Syntrophomonas curvata]